MFFRSKNLFAVVALGLGLAALGQAASPGLSLVLPRGGQRGSTVEVRFTGDRLGDVREVLFYSPGFEVQKIEPVPKKPKEPRATIAIAADCALGEHKLRLVTATGISPLQTFWVSQFPNASEKEPNNDFATPQVIPINTTVEGTVQNEDVDYYRVAAKKGQLLSAEIEAIRLSNTLFDPYIAILDAKRFELDAADDTPLLLQDCFASIVAPADGDYWIEVRDRMVKVTLGCAAENRADRREAQVSAVGITARRRCPVSPSRENRISSRSRRASPTIWRAQSSARAPSGVRPP